MSTAKGGFRNVAGISGKRPTYKEVPGKSHMKGLVNGMMTILTPTLVISFCCCVLLCSAAEPDRWKGLILNQTTPEQAIQVLGAPQKDATGQIEKLVRNRMFGRGSVFFLRARRTDLVRVLRYDSLEEFQTVSLMFKDGDLVLIHLMPSKANKIAAKDFEGLYENTLFRTIYADNDFWSQEYLIDHGDGSLRPKNFPDTYWIVGAKRLDIDSIVIGTVWNFPGFGRMLAQGIGTADPNIPGLIGAIDLLSAKLLSSKPTNESLKGEETKCLGIFPKSVA